MDITTVFGTVIAGSNPAGSTASETVHLRAPWAGFESLPAACLPVGRVGRGSPLFEEKVFSSNSFFVSWLVFCSLGNFL